MCIAYVVKVSMKFVAVQIKYFFQYPPTAKMGYWPFSSSSQEPSSSKAVEAPPSPASPPPPIENSPVAQPPTSELPSRLQSIPEEQKPQIHLNIPTRLLVIPACSAVVGGLMGLVRGGRKASLRFLAENAHRPPRTKQGWYFYFKTKNYKVMLGSVKGAALEGAKMGIVGTTWVGIEHGLGTYGGKWGDQGKEIGAGLGTAGVLSAICEYPACLSWNSSSDNSIPKTACPSRLSNRPRYWDCCWAQRRR